MELRIGGKVCGLGQGRSKKDAEENAAREALEKLGRE
jgi:dsRNA-specific ribonuclease